MVHEAMRCITIRWLILLLCSPLSACHSPFYADRGAAAGALSGALAGAAIGESQGDAGAGALVGGAVGTLAGAAIGNSIDQDIARSQAEIEQQLGRRLRGAVTVADVIAMAHADLGENVIITHIRSNGVAQPPQVEDLISLRDAGISDRVIQEMQQTPLPQGPLIELPPPPVVVEEHHYVAPPPWRGHFYVPPPWHRHPRHGRRGVRWGISFSN